MWRLTIPDVVVPMLPARHEFEEDETRGSLSATPLSIDMMEIEEFLLNIRTERYSNFDSYRNNIEFARCQDSGTDLQSDFNRMRYRFFQHESDSSTVILVDLEEAEPEFDEEYEQVINELRRGGREILAEELVEMLRNSQEDPEETEIKLFSLQGMARFLIEQEKFENPIVGAGPIGIMQAEWHIVGDGLLVMAFLEDNQIHCVVQTDDDSQGEMLYRSVQLSKNEALEEFGYLVPLREA